MQTSKTRGKGKTLPNRSQIHDLAQRVTAAIDRHGTADPFILAKAEGVKIGYCDHFPEGAGAMLFHIPEGLKIEDAGGSVTAKEETFVILIDQELDDDGRRLKVKEEMVRYLAIKAGLDLDDAGAVEAAVLLS